MSRAFSRRSLTCAGLRGNICKNDSVFSISTVRDSGLDAIGHFQDFFTIRRRIERSLSLGDESNYNLLLTGLTQKLSETLICVTAPEPRTRLFW
jgi:hypothetical protein